MFSLVKIVATWRDGLGTSRRHSSEGQCRPLGPHVVLGVPESAASRHAATKSPGPSGLRAVRPSPRPLLWTPRATGQHRRFARKSAWFCLVNIVAEFAMRCRHRDSFRAIPEPPEGGTPNIRRSGVRSLLAGFLCRPSPLHDIAFRSLVAATVLSAFICVHLRFHLVVFLRGPSWLRDFVFILWVSSPPRTAARPRDRSCTARCYPGRCFRCCARNASHASSGSS